MIEISDRAELIARCHGDTLCLWVAQGLSGRSRAWRSPDGTALAVAGPDLSTRDRIAVHGRAEGAIPLVHGVLEVVGSTFRPLGDRDLICAIVAGIPELAPAAEFGWMDSRSPASIRHGPDAAHWLPETETQDVDQQNHSAVRLYLSLGMSYRALTAAYVTS